MGEYPNEIDISTKKKEIKVLNLALDQLHEQSIKCSNEHHNQDVHFVTRISKLFDDEIAKQTIPRLKIELLYMGRWQFIKDWVNLRAETSREMKQLSFRIMTEVLLINESLNCLKIRSQ